MKNQSKSLSLIKSIVRDYPDTFDVVIDGVTFVFKPIRDASAVWLARKTAQSLADDTEKGRTKHLWGDLTPESGEVVMMASILTQFCVKIKGKDDDGNEIEEVPKIEAFLYLASKDCQRFMEVLDKFYKETSFNKVSSDEMAMIETEKKI